MINLNLISGIKGYQLAIFQKAGLNQAQIFNQYHYKV